MAIAISAPDLYEKCCQQAMKDNIAAENIPSFSWFKFQFLAQKCLNENSYGCLKVKYLMQQRMIRNQHYCAAILKYTREFAVEFKDYCSYVLMINIRLPLEHRICQFLHYQRVNEFWWGETKLLKYRTMNNTWTFLQKSV